MHFGLDIGSYSIKVIQAQPKGEFFTLQHWGEVATPVPISELNKKNIVYLAEAIKKLIAEAKISTSNVKLALSEASVYTQVIQLPPMSETELASAIEYEAEQYIPLPLEKVQLEYFVLSGQPRGLGEEKIDVLLIGAQKKAINDLLSVVNLLGLVPKAVETEILAVTRCLAVYPDTSLLVNMGKSSTELAILSGTDINFVSNIEMGGETLTRAVAQSLSLTIQQAEEYKKTYGLDLSVLDGKVAKSMTPVFDQLIAQIQKTFNYFSRKKVDNLSMSRVILSGGGVQLPGVNTYLTQKLGLEAVLGNPFSRFVDSDKFSSELLKASSRFSTAVGLAIRQD